MPRVKPLIRPDTRATAVLTEIGGGRAALQITQGELARRAGIDPSLLCKRLKNIGDMRLSEYWKLQDVIERGLK